MADMVIEFRHSKKRLLLLDYDGTLVDIQSNPENVVPSPKILDLLRHISDDPKNTIAIITGRDQNYISQYFSDFNLYIFAEHGSFMKAPGKDWINLYTSNSEWKKKIGPILTNYTLKNKNSFMEEKLSSITWHYREIDQEHIFETLKALKFELREAITPEMNIMVLEGKKVIEVKEKNTDKGTAARMMMALDEFQFVLSIGDDTTDEDMFKVLPPYAYSFKVGYGTTLAKINLDNTEDVVRILDLLN